jgi:integrase
VVQLLRENNARQRYFTEDEIRRIFLSADNDTSPVAARYVKLLLLTGLRRDELRLAKWEHVDPVKRTLWLLKPRMAMDGLFILTHWRWT